MSDQSLAESLDKISPILSAEGLHSESDLACAPQTDNREVEDWPRMHPVSPLDKDKDWAAIGLLKRSLELLPDVPAGVSRMDQCVAMLRGQAEIDLFPGALPDAPSGDGVRLIQYPLIELNWLVDATQPTILSLLDYVDIERTTRERLRRELVKEEPFLESDDRGTIQAYTSPTGMTKEKERNNVRLDALAVFLHSLRKQPFALTQYAIRELNKVAIPVHVLSADMRNSTVTFRSTNIPVSNETCVYIQLLVKSVGCWVTSTDVENAIPGNGKVRPDRLKLKLPKLLKDAIETTKVGSRLHIDRLLTNP